MATPKLGSFDTPDEVIELELLRSELVHLGGLTISRTSHMPGWRWRTHLSPQVGGEWCQTRHVGIVTSGRLHLVMDDGSEIELHAGQTFELPPGHDGWVVGDEPYVDVTWSGARTWLPVDGRDPHRVLATVLLTDMVSSTEMASSMGDLRWADLIATLEERVRDKLGEHGGREVKTTGDGVLALFTSTARAVHCAVALQEVAEDLGIGLRVAVHTGEVDLAGDDIRGVVVHELSRILGFAGVGKIIVSAMVAQLVAESGVNLADLGEVDLRGIPGQMRLYEVA